MLFWSEIKRNLQTHKETHTQYLFQFVVIMGFYEFFLTPKPVTMKHDNLVVVRGGKKEKNGRTDNTPRKNQQQLPQLDPHGFVAGTWLVLETGSHGKSP